MALPPSRQELEGAGPVYPWPGRGTSAARSELLPEHYSYRVRLRRSVP